MLAKPRIWLQQTDARADTKVQDLLPQQRYHKFSLPPEAIEANLARAKRSKAIPSDSQGVLKKILQTKRPLKPYPSDFVLVDDASALRQATETLEQIHVIGIDLEHNGQNSYDGFCCLLQISAFPAESEALVQTFIIDLLADGVRSSLTATLGERVLENPSIVKILHGGISSDIVWLQRDFGIQIQSGFDTQEFQKHFVSNQKLSLANFWEQYCEGQVKYSLNEKGAFQMADWSERPLDAAKLDYAANDSYFLGHIAVQQVQRVLGEKTEKDIVTWIDSFNVKVHSAKYSQRCDNFDNETYRKPFRKFMDFYDPQSDDFLMAELVYRDLFALRETLSQLLDINKKQICHDDLIGILARKRPRSEAELTQLVEDHSINGIQIKGIETYRALFLCQINQSLSEYPEQKQALMDGNKKTKPKGGKQTQVTRETLKEERRQNQVNNVKYDNCKIFDNEGRHIFNCNEKKAVWYLNKGYGYMI